MNLVAAEHAAGVLADLRVRAPGSGVLTELPESCRPKSLIEAYSTQARLRELLGFRAPGRQVGWKIGCTTKVMQDYLKIPHPCAGTLYKNSVYTNEVTIKASDYYTLGLECEIAVRLAKDMPRLPTPRNRDSVWDAVSEIMASIEIVEHRFADFTKVKTSSLVADDFFSAGCVVGTSMDPEDLSDMAQLRGGFSIDGAIPERTGSGSEILGHPLTALAWLADHAAGLRARFKSL